MGESLQPLVDSLAVAAESASDIYELVFARYFELCPDSRELLEHTDDLIRGRMMEQVMSLLMDEDLQNLELYFKFEVANHEGYGALLPMYGHLFCACKDVTQSYSSSAWTEQTNSVWDAQISLLLELIEKHSSR